MSIDSYLLAFGLVIVGAVVPERIDNVTQPVATPVQVIVSKDKSLDPEKMCLTSMIYGEARGESFYGKVAVAWSAVNRFDMASYVSMCDIVFDKDQYSAFADKPELVAVATNRVAPPVNADWEESEKVANLVYDGVLPDPTNGATHFVNLKKLKFVPRWVRKFRQVYKIENHSFYKETRNG